MQRIRRRKIRYGEPDFDREYLAWGFHDGQTQHKEAESVLAIVDPSGPLDILDVGCGRGTHAAYWAEKGHRAIGIDLSATFVADASKVFGHIATAAFRVQDLKTLQESASFDIVTWIERPFLDPESCSIIARSLRPGGLFVTDVRNPSHPKWKGLSADSRTWREKDGVFHLERHGTNPATGRHEDLWILVDPEHGLVIEEYEPHDPQSCGKGALSESAAMLHTSGFGAIHFKTMQGDEFDGGEEPYWLWMVAEKTEV